MARGKARNNIIEVKESEKRYTNCYGVGNFQEVLKESRRKACELEMAEKLAKMSQKELKLDSSSLTTADNEVDQGSAMKQATPEADELQKKDEFNEVGYTEGSAESAVDTFEANLVNAEQAFIQYELQKKGEFIDVQLAQLEGSADGNANDKGLLEPNLMIAGQADGDGQKKKKRKKKKKDKKNKKKSNADTDVSEAEKDMADTEVKRPVRLAPIKKLRSTNMEEELKTKDLREAKGVGCFGFINSWLVKRREKRRSKKRQAIEARQSKAGENLVVYGNKRARGGVAFTVELDSRPIDRSVLPPIAKRPGPIRVATEQKLENAETKREQQLDKKREAARAHSRLVEAADRRAQNEEEYKQKTHEKVYRKHSKAAESKHINKKIEAARAHSRLVRETAEKRAKCEAEFKQATLYKILLKGQKTSSLLQRAREEQRSRCASRCATRCASRMDSAQGAGANHDTYLDN